MTTRGSADIGFVLIAGRAIGTDLLSIKDSKEMVMEEITGLGHDDDHWAPVGVKEYTVNLNGFYNDNSDGDESLAALALDGAQCLFYSLEPNAIGAHCIFGVVQRQPFNKNPERRALTKVSADYKSELGAYDGVVSAELDTRVDDDETASIDNAASSANGAAGQLGITALDLDGGDDITIKLEDSPDDSVWADLIVFDAVTSLSDALRAQQKHVTGTVDQYTRTSWEFAANAGAAKSITFATAIARN